MLLQAILPSVSVAARFNVNSSQDVNDLEPGNGLCVAYLFVFPPYVLPFCTLRGAIEETNNLPGADIIHIPEGTFTLTLDERDEDNAYTGDLDITDSLTIVGMGVNKTFIDADNLDRVFDIFGPASNVTIANLSIAHGNLTVAGDNPDGGGGIRNNATLRLQDTTIYENTINGSGGGIFNQATCTVTNTTIEGNSAMSGGGIFNDQNAVLNVSSSTINNNSAESGGGLANIGSGNLANVTINANTAKLGKSPHGGGISNSGKLDILQSTIAGNDSDFGGGIANSGVVSLINTIITDNTNDNCSTAAGLFSLGFNMENSNTCGLDRETDMIGAAPDLEKLNHNGGPTRTMALRVGSPAIDAGKDLRPEGIDTDQRGEKRPSGEGFDIGAYERQKAYIVPLLVPLLFNQIK